MIVRNPRKVTTFAEGVRSYLRGSVHHGGSEVEAFIFLTDAEERRIDAMMLQAEIEIESDRVEFTPGIGLYLFDARFKD